MPGEYSVDQQFADLRLQAEVAALWQVQKLITHTAGLKKGRELVLVVARELQCSLR